MKINPYLIFESSLRYSGLHLFNNLFFRFIFALLFVFIFGCTKDKGKLIPNTPALLDQDKEFVCEDTAFDWSGTPPTPDFDFILWSKWGKEAPWRVLYDPNDENVIFYTTSEPNNANHILWKYDRKRNLKKLIDEQVLINISINKNGWLVYEKIDQNIYKIKTNGDSLTQLTIKGTYMSPSWSEDGAYIFYQDKYFGKPGKCIIQTSSKGDIIDTLENVGRAEKIHSRGHYYYFTDFDGKEFSIVQLDLNTGLRKTIVSKNNNMGEEMGDCYTDLANTTLYWYNNSGLFTTNINTLHTTRLINGGHHSKNWFYHYQLSPINGHFICIRFITEVVNEYTLLGSSKIVEFKPDGICRRTVQLPD